MIMPGGMNGYQLARQMRTRHPAIKVLLTTGYAGAAEGTGASSANQEFDMVKKSSAALAHRVTKTDRYSTASESRSALRFSLPTAVFGMASTKITRRGLL